MRLAKLTAIGAVVGSIDGFWTVAKSPGAPAATSPDRLMNFVAHQDDDLLFLSPDLLNAITGGASVRTVFLTAGDAGNGIAYWSAREEGSRAAYAQMAGVPDIWTHNTMRAAGHVLETYTLAARPTISLVFMRLPDGSLDGTGNVAYGHQSLQKLYTGAITRISTVDGSASYTRTTLIDSLLNLMTSFKPTAIHTQDYAGHFGDGDHSDHHATAYLTWLANEEYEFVASHTFAGFEDYGTAQRPPNVSDADHAAKISAFRAYARYDHNVCWPWSVCEETDYSRWVARQYVIGRIAASPR